MLPLLIGGGDVPFVGPTGRRLSAHLHMNAHLVFSEGNLLDRRLGGRLKGRAFSGCRRVLPRLTGRPFVFLVGHRVAAAAGLSTDYFRWMKIGSVPAAVIPHPSGVNRWWNDVENRLEFRSFVGRAFAERAPHALNEGLVDLSRLLFLPEFSFTRIDLLHWIEFEGDLLRQIYFDRASRMKYREEERSIFSTIARHMRTLSAGRMQFYSLRLFRERLAVEEIRVACLRFGRTVRSTAVWYKWV